LIFSLPITHQILKNENYFLYSIELFAADQLENGRFFFNYSNS
jgi:hypothetical protein